MSRLFVVPALIFVIAVSMALSGVADEPQTPAAGKIRDEAISQTSAWRTKPADVTLKNASGIEDSQPYLTAKAFLMATTSLNQGTELVERAVEILQDQTQRDLKDPVSQYCLGVVLNWLEKPGPAKTAWSRARDRADAMIKVEDRNAAAHFYRGAALIQLKKPGEAIKALKKADRYGFDPTMVNFQLGLAYLLEKKWKPAKEAFDEVHTVDPRFAHLYFYRALAWDKLGRKDKMLNDFDQFVRLAPNSAEAKTARAMLSAMR